MAADPLIFELECVRAAASTAWQHDGAALLTAEDDWYYQQVTEGFAASLRRAYRVGWDLDLAKVSLRDLDRERPMMNGPLFTSAAHPWPKASNGWFALPIVQLDLAEVSALSGRPLGTGLAQLWQHGVQMITRIVPDHNLRGLDATDIPVMIADSTIDPLHVALGDHGLPYFLTDVRQVTGYSGPYLFGPAYLDPFLDRYIGDARCSSALCAALGDMRVAVNEGRDRFAQVSRLLGSFDPINHQPEEHPPALFSSDDGGILNTGDEGVIAMYAEWADDHLQLSATFDCC